MGRMVSNTYKPLTTGSLNTPRRSGTAFAVTICVSFYYIFELRGVLKMAEENSTGSNLIWAVAMIIIVAIIAGAVYYGGLLSGNQKKDIDVEVKVPTAGSNR